MLRTEAAIINGSATIHERANAENGEQLYQRNAVYVTANRESPGMSNANPCMIPTTIDWLTIF